MVRRLGGLMFDTPKILLTIVICLTSPLDSAGPALVGPPGSPNQAAQVAEGTAIVSYPQPVDNSPQHPQTVKEIAHTLVTNWFSDTEWRCYANIIHIESRWQLNADNPTSTAWGIGQILNSKDNVGLDPYKQAVAALNYMIHKYQTPCKAWAFHKKHHWY